jgi:hypothetical protein
MRPPIFFFALVLAPAVAHADGALEEVSAGNVPQTATSAPSTWVADKLAGMWEPGEAWQLRLDLVGTRTLANNDTGDVLLATLGVEYDPDDHWMVRVAGGGSPSATTFSTTTLQLPTMSGIVPVDAKLQSDASSLAASASAGYETGTDDDFETTALVTANATRFDALQQIASVDGRSQTFTVQQLRDICAKRTCSSALNSTLAAQATTLDQLAVGGTLSEQIYRDTDVGVDGAYYLYDKDPTTIGYFSALGVGRTTTGTGIAPLQYTVAPSVIHRFGALMAMSSVSYGRYVDQDGYDVTATLRVQYKLKLGGDKRLKLWTKATGSHDRDQMNTLSKSGSLALGVQYAW